MDRGLGHLLQNDFSILAAFSHSLSRFVGQYVSLPKRVLIGSGARERLPDEVPFQPNILFRAVGAGLAVPVVSVGFSEALALALALADLDLSHDGIRPETRCMLGAVVSAQCL